MRPSDWSPLGLWSDPTPGDPVMVRAGGQEYPQVADALSRSSATLRTLSGGASSGAEPVKALLDNTTDLAGQIELAEARYRVAGDALVEYSYVLDRTQSTTLQALSSAKNAAADATEHRRLARLYERLADDAVGGEQYEERLRYRRLQRDYDNEAGIDQAKVEAQKQVAQGAAREQERAANEAADKIEVLTGGSPLNDTWWDDLGAKVLKWVAKIAELVATIAGVLALVLCWVPVLGQALLAISALAGIVAALANIVLAAAGEQGWGEAVVSIIFAALGCVGLGGAKGILGALKGGAGLLKAGGLTSLGGLKGVLGATKAGWTTLLKAQKGLLGNKFSLVIHQFHLKPPKNPVPRYGVLKTKTSGVFIRPNGQETAIVSGYKGPTADLPLGLPGMNGHLKAHVEAHSGAIIRLEGLQRGTTWINRLPCPTRGKVAGCDQYLPLYVPSGSALFLHVIPEGSMTTPIRSILTIGKG